MLRPNKPTATGRPPNENKEQRIEDRGSRIAAQSCRAGSPSPPLPVSSTEPHGRRASVAAMPLAAMPLAARGEHGTTARLPRSCNVNEASAVDRARISTLLCILASWRCCAARRLPVRAPDAVSWHSFTALNGLAGNIVQSIWEDPQGRLWFGTEKGASRYDGSSWQTYRSGDGLVDDNVWSISGDASAVWFATSNGLSRLAQDRWTHYSTDDGLPNNDVRAVLVARDGSVWAGTFGGGVVWRRSGSARWQQLDFSSVIANRDIAVQSIWQAPDGALWFSTSAFGALRRAPDGKLVRFSFVKGSRNTVWAVGAGQADGSLWAVTFRGAVQIAPGRPGRHPRGQRRRHPRRGDRDPGAGLGSAGLGLVWHARQRRAALGQRRLGALHHRRRPKPRLCAGHPGRSRRADLVWHARRRCDAARPRPGPTGSSGCARRSPRATSCATRRSCWTTRC